MRILDTQLNCSLILAARIIIIIIIKLYAAQ